MTAWPRALRVVHGQRGAQAVDRALTPLVEDLVLGCLAAESESTLEAELGPYVQRAPPEPAAQALQDPWLRERLVALDRAYAGVVPAPHDPRGERLAAVQAMHARRRLYEPPLSARPTLPASVLHRAARVWARRPQRVAVLEDVDGLGVLLAEQCEVVAGAATSFQGRWLAAEAERAGVGDRLQVVSASVGAAFEVDGVGAFDVCVMAAGPPAAASGALERALAMTRPGGSVVVSACAPWSRIFLQLLEKRALPVRAHLRDVDHVVLPGGQVLDTPTELIEIEVPQGGARRSLVAAMPDGAEPVSDAAAVRAAPYHWLEVCLLRPQALQPGAAHGFLDALAQWAPRTEVKRHVCEVRCSDGSREAFLWVDDGSGVVTGTLHLDRGYLMIAFTPADADVEYGAVLAAVRALGDELTRVRPHRPWSKPVPYQEQGGELLADGGPEPATTAVVSGEADQPYHLADGVMLAISRRHVHLLDYRRNVSLTVDPELVPALERIALGGTLSSAGFEIAAGDGVADVAARLLANGFVVEGPLGEDPVLREALVAVDRAILGDFADALDSRQRAAYEAVLSAHARRKRFFGLVGQLPICPATALRRALLLEQSGGGGAKDVVCIGDDDLVSVALAALGHRVTVLDVDDHLLQCLRSACEALGLRVTLQRCDLRDPVDPGLLGRFDAFLTDPMPNRACFELFVSRGSALLRPEGLGFVAAETSAGRLLRDIAAEMSLAVTRGFARFNRYYSCDLHLHPYESDWVEVQKTPRTTPTYGPDAYAVPAGLYGEMGQRRGAILQMLVDDIQDVQWATPLFLDMLLDVLEQACGISLPERVLHTTEDWSVLHCPMADGYMTLRVDRAKRQITAIVHPHIFTVGDRLRDLLVSAYKTSLDRFDVSPSKQAWDVRIE